MTISQGGGVGWYSPRKGVRGHAALKESLFTLSQQFPKTPISACFSSLRPLFNKKFTILEPIFTKISVPKPQIWQNFSSKASNWYKIKFFKLLFLSQKVSFLSPLFLVPDCSLSPHLRPFGLHTYTKMKVKYPLGTISLAFVYGFQHTRCQMRKNKLYII